MRVQRGDMVRDNETDEMDGQKGSLVISKLNFSGRKAVIKRK